MRYWWGLNSILQKDGSDRKNRDDHRHHAVNALVIALTDEKRLFALANARGENMPPPWQGFREEASRSILGISVSHRVQRRLHGKFHEATFYGATQKASQDVTSGRDSRSWAKDWVEDEKVFVRRKAVDSLTKTQDLKKVRDPTIRLILEEASPRPWCGPRQGGQDSRRRIQGRTTCRVCLRACQSAKSA